MSKLVGIPAAQLTEAWRAVEPFIVRACAGSNGRFKPADMAKAIADKEFQLWAEVRDADICAVGVTRIVKYPQLVACEFLACVGEDMASWKYHMSQVEDWARTQGCKQNLLVARKGWARVMRDQGYAHTHSLLEKTL